MTATDFAVPHDYAVPTDAERTRVCNTHHPCPSDTGIHASGRQVFTAHHPRRMRASARELTAVPAAYAPPGARGHRYRDNQSVCGIPLLGGLREASRLADPIFTPAAKAALGDHDENVSFERVADMVGPQAAASLRDATLDLYSRAADIARERGIILADTKFEFGAGPDGELVLGDEVLTPDSSRFWPADQWMPLLR